MLPPRDSPFLPQARSALLPGLVKDKKLKEKFPLNEG
jgi:hypothetical protein